MLRALIWQDAAFWGSSYLLTGLSRHSAAPSVHAHALLSYLSLLYSPAGADSKDSFTACKLALQCCQVSILSSSASRVRMTCVHSSLSTPATPHQLTLKHDRAPHLLAGLLQLAAHDELVQYEVHLRSRGQVMPAMCLTALLTQLAAAAQARPARASMSHWLRGHTPCGS